MRRKGGGEFVVEDWWGKVKDSMKGRRKSGVYGRMVERRKGRGGGVEYEAGWERQNRKGKAIRAERVGVGRVRKNRGGWGRKGGKERVEGIKSEGREEKGGGGEQKGGGCGFVA